MRAACLNSESCPYKSDTGYCGYTGKGCILDNSVIVNASETKIPYNISYLVDISPDSIDKIADAVVEKLCKAKLDEVKE